VCGSGDIHQGVVSFTVEKWPLTLALNPLKVKFMHVARSQGIDMQSHPHAILRDDRLGDLELLLVILGSTVAAFQAIGVTLHRIGFHFGSGGRIHRLGKAQGKPIGLGLHFMDFKGHLAGPPQALEPPGTIAPASPASVRHADKE